jgi:hypothetical protein
MHAANRTEAWETLNKLLPLQTFEGGGTLKMKASGNNDTISESMDSLGSSSLNSLNTSYSNYQCKRQQRAAMKERMKQGIAGQDEIEKLRQNPHRIYGPLPPLRKHHRSRNNNNNNSNSSTNFR